MHSWHVSNHYLQRSALPHVELFLLNLDFQLAIPELLALLLKLLLRDNLILHLQVVNGSNRDLSTEVQKCRCRVDVAGDLALTKFNAPIHHAQGQVGSAQHLSLSDAPCTVMEQGCLMYSTVS